MDWVHCNICFVQPGDVASKKFLLTNCGHIYCDECVKQNPSSNCKICHSRYSTTPLTANMSPEVEMYFLEPLENIKKQLKISEFQKTHRNRLISFYKDVIRNYSNLKSENYAVKEEIKKYKMENAALRQEVERVKEGFHKLEKKYRMRIPSERPVIPHQKAFPLPRSEERRSPKSPCKFPGTDDISESTFNVGLKRPGPSNYFHVTESTPAEKKQKKKSFPKPRNKENSQYNGYFRSQKSTPKLSTPSYIENLISELNQKKPLQRKVNLPSNRNSSTAVMGFQGLTLSMRTSTPYKNYGPTNKYSKYF